MITRKILFLDDHVPYPDLGVGCPRARRLIHALHDAGYSLTFVPLECPDDDRQSMRCVLPDGVEVILGMLPSQLSTFLCSRIGYFDLVFVSRPDNMRILLSALHERPVLQGGVPIIYDAEAIFAAREILRRAVEGLPLSEDEQAQMLREEMMLAQAASHVTAVSEAEFRMLRSSGCTSLSLLGDGFRVTPTPRPHLERIDILFVGSLDDDPSPNVDALTWFVAQVFPRIKDGLKEPVRLTIAGRCGASRVRALAASDVVLLGKVADLRPVYDAARVFIAPHRYAAGIPNKVLEASAHGVPCIVSDLLASQLGWRDGIEVLSAATAENFARSVIRLYTEAGVWSTIRTNVLNTLRKDYGEAGFRERLASALQRSGL